MDKHLKIITSWLKDTAKKNLNTCSLGSLYSQLLDEGYSIIIPVYHNTWGRKKIIRDWWPNETEEYKNTIIKIGKDFKRIVDFLETRNNLDFKKLSYYGYSWGSVTSNILLAIEKRIKSAVICVGGLMLQKSRKEIESHLYIRRIKIPILHIVGKLDDIVSKNGVEL